MLYLHASLRSHKIFLPCIEGHHSEVTCASGSHLSPEGISLPEPKNGCKKWSRYQECHGSISSLWRPTSLLLPQAQGGLPINIPASSSIQNDFFSGLDFHHLSHMLFRNFFLVSVLLSQITSVCLTFALKQRKHFGNLRKTSGPKFKPFIPPKLTVCAMNKTDLSTQNM